MGNRISKTSADNTSPAPREIQTENVSVLSAASRLSSACFILHAGKILFCADLPVNTHHPYTNNATWKPQNKK